MTRSDGFSGVEGMIISLSGDQGKEKQHRQGKEYIALDNTCVIVVKEGS